jgi:hypothetical protein
MNDVREERMFGKGIESLPVIQGGRRALVGAWQLIHSHRNEGNVRIQ